MKSESGYTGNGLAYNRFGTGPKTLLVLQGLMFENKPMPDGMLKSMTGSYRVLESYTIYLLNRKPDLPDKYSLNDMAGDYADFIERNLNGPVDVIGLSTGGSIALYLAADHPELVHKLVIHSSAHTLGPAGKSLQLQVAEMARAGKWVRAYMAIFLFIMPESRIKRVLLWPLFGIFALLSGTIGAPKDPSDLIVTILAEDLHAFQDRLASIRTPTLVVAGDCDPFYSEELFRETSEGIPDCKLILYKGMGHPASGKEFRKDLTEFLSS